MILKSLNKKREMKTIILRYILAIILCGIAIIGKATEYCFTQDFSKLPSSGAVSQFQGWICTGCVAGMNESWSNLALKVENDLSGTTSPGYAISPELNYEGDVYLYFSYARGSDRETKVVISIEGQGKFEDNSSSKTITITTGSQAEFSNKSYRILNVNSSTRIKFSESAIDHTFAIDNVKVAKSPRLFLSEFLNNSTDITNQKDNIVSVATTRTITGGIWNTMCLPFRVYEDVLKLALGDNQDIQLRTFSGYNAGVMSFSAATEVQAGIPFLIKINETVTNPTFPVVTIKEATAQTVTHGDVSFVGTYSKVDLSTDGTNLFLTTRNTLASPASDKNTMNGLRAYIVVPQGFDPTNARIMMDDGETTAISALAPSTETSPKATYNLKGQRVENARRGLYVVNGKLTLVK